jgi:hypothetical protein
MTQRHIGVRDGDDSLVRSPAVAGLVLGTVLAARERTARPAHASHAAVGIAEYRTASRPSRSASPVHSAGDGALESSSHALNRGTEILSNSAAFDWVSLFSCRFNRMWSPSVFTLVGNDFRGIRFTGMWLRDARIVRWQIPNSCIPWGEGELQSAAHNGGVLFIKTLADFLPLRWGEGRGEGERGILPTVVMTRCKSGR